MPQVLVMTHAAKPPPDGQNGPMDYDAYINHRMNALQQGVRSALCPPPVCPAGLAAAPFPSSWQIACCSASLCMTALYYSRCCISSLPATLYSDGLLLQFLLSDCRQLTYWLF